MSFEKLDMEPLEESELRRLMDHFDRDGDPSYIDFVKVLTSEAGSPKKYGASSSSSAPLYVRVQHAMMSRPLDAHMLKEIFLPSDVMDTNETLINFKEMEVRCLTLPPPHHPTSYQLTTPPARALRPNRPSSPSTSTSS